MTQNNVAEVFSPGEFIREELEARDWSQVELAEILGRQPRLVNELVLGKRAITPETAKALAEAFGTSAGYWMNLESAYRLGLAKEADNVISRRSRLYERAPIKDMTKRHWIEQSANIDVLEDRVMKHFESSSLDEPFQLPHAAKKGTVDITSAHVAWLYRAKHLAKTVPAKKFTENSFNTCIEKLRSLTGSVQDIKHVPQILADSGIRFLIVEHLPKTKIDGAVFWLNKESPVIVLSLRYDRIDNFWHTLFHELCHVKNKDGQKEPIIDSDLLGSEEQTPEETSGIEKKANICATKYLIDESEINDFILRVKPIYSAKKILGFAKRINVHPGIVVGQLQNRKEIPWSNYRGMLEKVRSAITQVVLTDGWGQGSPQV